LDLLILKSLNAGELHGLGISRRIQQITGGLLSLSPVALSALHRRKKKAGFPLFGENPRTTAAPNTTALPRLEGNSLSRDQAVGPRFLGYCSSFGSIVESFGMPLFVKVRSFLRNLFLSRRVEVDLDQEVHSPSKC